MKIGDKVNVNLGRRGGIQSGTVTKVLPDGRFQWKNVCNYQRTAKAQDVTTDAPREGKLDPYIKAWMDDKDE